MVDSWPSSQVKMVAPLCLLSTLILVINLSCLPSYWWVTNGDPFLLHSPLKKTGLDSKPWKKNVLNMAFFFGNFLHVKLIGTYLDVSPDVLKVANLLQFDEVLFGLQVQMSNGRWYKLGSSLWSPEGGVAARDLEIWPFGKSKCVWPTICTTLVWSPAHYWERGRWSCDPFMFDNEVVLR